MKRRRIWWIAGCVVTVVLGLAATAVGAQHLHAVKDRADEYTWLAAHAKTADYRVVELGEVAGDGRALAVWVDRPGQPQAFVDLDGSHEDVTSPGQTVSARVDDREAPATGYGVAADVLGRSFIGDYLRTGWPLGVAIACWLAALALGAAAGRERRLGRVPSMAA